MKIICQFVYVKTRNESFQYNRFQQHIILNESGASPKGLVPSEAE